MPRTGLRLRRGGQGAPAAQAGAGGPGDWRRWGGGGDVCVWGGGRSRRGAACLLLPAWACMHPFMLSPVATTGQWGLQHHTGYSIPTLRTGAASHQPPQLPAARHGWTLRLCARLPNHQRHIPAQRRPLCLFDGAAALARPPACPPAQRWATTAPTTTPTCLAPTASAWRACATATASGAHWTASSRTSRYRCGRPPEGGRGGQHGATAPSGRPQYTRSAPHCPASICLAR